MEAALADVVGMVNGAPDALDALAERQNYRLAYWRAAARTSTTAASSTSRRSSGYASRTRGFRRHAHARARLAGADGTIAGLRIDHIDGLRDPAGLPGAAPRTPRRTPRSWSRRSSRVTKSCRGRGRSRHHGYDGAQHGARAVRRPVRGAAARPSCTRSSPASSGRSTTSPTSPSSSSSTPSSPRRPASHPALRRRRRAAPPAPRTTPAAPCGTRREHARLPSRSIAPTRATAAADVVAVARKAMSERRSGHRSRPGRLSCRPLASERGAWTTSSALRFQQLSGPVTAKGVEDTAFYRYHRLVALNEVGGDPDRFGVGVDDVPPLGDEGSRSGGPAR